MSVLSAIKGTIVSVKQDLRQSLNQLTNSSEAEPFNEGGDLSNVDTGAELLHRYSNNWKEIHKNSEDLSRRAQIVDGLTMQLYQSLDKKNVAMNHLLSELSTVTQLCTDVNSIKLQIEKLSGGFSSVEQALLELEDVVEQQEQQVQRTYHETQLKHYQQRRHKDLELAKASLSVKHACRVKELEDEISRTLLERQKVFDQAHAEQMHRYRDTGLLEGRRLESVPVTTVEDIGDVVIDNNINELERFLSDIEQQQPGEQQEQQKNKAEEKQQQEQQHGEQQQKEQDNQTEGQQLQEQQQLGEGKEQHQKQQANQAEEQQQDGGQLQQEQQHEDGKEQLQKPEDKNIQQQQQGEENEQRPQQIQQQEQQPGQGEQQQAEQLEQNMTEQQQRQQSETDDC